MNIQTVRTNLKEAFAAAGVLPPGWRVSTDTRVEKVASKLVQIGHARTITPGTYRAFAVVLELTLWVTEDESTGVIGEFYALVSPDAGNILALAHQACREMDGVSLAGELSVTDIGPREEGPSGFLAATLTIPLVVK